MAPVIDLCLDAHLGKPPPQLGGQSGTRSGPVGAKDPRPRNHKDREIPVSSTAEVSSSPGNPPTTVNSSSPFGSVKKGKVTSTAQSYPSECAQKGNNPKRRPRGVGDPIDTTSQQVCYSFPIQSQHSLFGTLLYRCKAGQLPNLYPLPRPTVWGVRPRLSPVLGSLPLVRPNHPPLALVPPR